MVPQAGQRSSGRAGSNLAPSDTITVMNIIDDFAQRNLIASSTDLDRLRAYAESPVSLYCGFDPTGASLHVGHLVPLLGLARFQRVGHRPIALLGGGTGLIGDPRMSGERHLHSADVVREMADRIRPQLERFLDFDPGPSQAVLVDNHDWLGELSAIGFLRDVGKHFPLGPMLAKETVRSRLHGVGISFTEFSYMLLQAYDFLCLSRRFGCLLQIGGSDQWGNLTAGVDLIRRCDGAGAHALTMPLITRADGTKFGKSEGAAVWLDAAMTSPYAFYQYWLNADDADAVALVGYLHLPRSGRAR